MRVTWLAFGACAAIGAALVSRTQAEIIITTNMGGADAEVREEQTTFDAETGVVFAPNRGAQTELATRIRNDVAFSGDVITDPHPGSNAQNNSIMFMKFNIANLAPADSPFWDDKEVILRLRVHTNNMSPQRLLHSPPAGAGGNPDDPSTFVRQTFNVHGLDPNGTYLDDGASATRTDRNGNNYTSTQYRYDWNEGDNSAGSGITYMDAPGLTPFCMDGLSCNPNESFGEFAGDFNGDAKLLGQWQWPNVAPANHLPTGMPLDYIDANLKQLVLDAKAAGRTSVTIMVSSAMDGTMDRPTLGINGTTPANFIAFNYIAVPKEHLLLQDDTSFDPNTTTPNFPTDPLGDPLGSPYSCSFNEANRPHCTGRGDNAGGAFSPALIIRVPEPTSMLLLALGSMLAWSSVGRRRAA